MKMLKTITVLTLSLVIFAFTAKVGEKTISEMVAKKAELSTLSTALEAAELVETLKGEGPFTVFAPTNEGFNNLPEGKLDELLKPENRAELVKVLKYHVVAGEIRSTDIKGEQILEALDGSQIRISASSESDEMMEEGDYESSEYASGKVKVNNATVVEADIQATNGIIHIIDGVVMPSDIETMGAVEQPDIR